MLGGNFSFSYGFGLFGYCGIFRYRIYSVKFLFAQFRNLQIREIAFIKLFNGLDADVVASEINLTAL